MAYEMIRYETRGAVAIVTYDRQDRRNAWNVPMYREIVDAVETANASEAVRAIVLAAEGPVFCSGVDIKTPPEPKDPVTGRRVSIGTETMAQDNSWVHLMERSKPVIAAVRGKALGLGVSHILAADVRVGGEGSSYGFAFLKRGTMPEVGATALLPRLVGFGRAMDLCLSAEEIDGAEAYRIGLISRLVPDEQVLETAIAVAERIGEFLPFQVKLTKDLINANATEGDANTYLGRETDAFVAMFRARKAESEAKASA